MGLGGDERIARALVNGNCRYLVFSIAYSVVAGKSATDTNLFPLLCSPVSPKRLNCVC